MSSIRNFIVPVRITHSRLATPHSSHQFVEKVANSVSTAAGRVGDSYDRAKKHAKNTKELLTAKIDIAKERIKKASIWDRLSLWRIFGDDVELV
jgi:hypothetical protein